MVSTISSIFDFIFINIKSKAVLSLNSVNGFLCDAK
jgi:hypothetical protein